MLLALADEIVSEVRESIASGAWIDARGNSRQGHMSTGELLNSTGIIEQGSGFVSIGSTSAHAGFHEFGTSRMQAHPVFQPVITSKAGRFADILVYAYGSIR